MIKDLKQGHNIQECANYLNSPFSWFKIFALIISNRNSISCLNDSSILLKNKTLEY